MMSLHSLLHLLLVAFITWCGITLYLYFSQSRMLYYPELPSRALDATPADIGLPFETIHLTTEDGIQLHAWYVPAVAARGTLLFNHGNAGNIAHRLDSIRLFNSLGLNVLIYDYRGFGESGGKPSEQGTYRDARAAWDYLHENRAIAARRIVILGRSLGAAIAVDLASQVPSAGVILESAFTSVPDMAAHLYPWLPVRFLVRYKYDSAVKIGRISSPLLMMHSRDDEIIPFSQGEELFAHANEPKRFLELNGGHNDGHHASHEAYTKALQQFLDMILPPAGDAAAPRSSQ
ncbi:MAG: alpha/beta hydrolase [Gammaproteobacteria bacterium]